MRLNSGHDTILWTRRAALAQATPPTWRQVPIETVVALEPGHERGHFPARAGDKALQETQARSLSVVYSLNGVKEETLDLVAPSAVAFDLWAEGLERLVPR